MAASLHSPLDEVDVDEVYMTKRVHSALDYVPPVEFEAQWIAEHLET